VRYTKQTTQANVGVKSIQKFLFPLPPLAEQRRIVAKIDQLMARCDELEKLRVDRSQRLLTVHTAALDRLLTARDSSEFSTAWSFITQHFGELYSVKENVVELRKTILQLAVMGKLVRQDPNDEPASELLRSIELEKQRLVKEGKIKAQKPLPIVNEDEQPFKLPKSWIWARSEDTAQFIDPQPSHRTPPEYENGIPYVGYSDIDHIKGIDLLNARKVSPRVFEEHSQRYQLKLGDFVFGKIGTLGQPFFLNEPFDYCLSANLILIQPNPSIIHPKYLATFLDSPSFLTFLDGNKTNSTHGVFGIKKARLICLPLPPLAEQRRIVEKIDRLMGMCDRLEESISSGKGKQTDLLNALMSQV
jgi:type I restriction enzyme, S subunit